MRDGRMDVRYDDKLKVRLRLFGHIHVRRREEEDCVKRILEADVRGQHSRERQRKRWIDVVKYNMEDFRLNLVDVENRAEWRRRTRRMADPSPEGSTASKGERKRVGDLIWFEYLVGRAPKLGHHTDGLWCVNNLPKVVT